MKHTARKFVSVFGLCVIIASLCSGCATSNARPVVNLNDLDFFQPDCKMKSQQIAFLQSLRRTTKDGLTFSAVSGYDARVNWTINTHLIYLSQYC